MTTPSDFSGVIPVADMRGDNPIATHLLQVGLAQARAFMSGFRWCKEIKQEFWGMGAGGVLGVFLFQIIPNGPDIDEWLWVIVGNLPTWAYITSEGNYTPKEALEGYLYEMQRWVDAARKGESVTHLIPMHAAPTRKIADNIEPRLKLIRQRFLSECGRENVPKEEKKQRRMRGPLKSQASSAKTVYLAKANDDLISFCNCEKALASAPPQMDCPWCGCGWLFTCLHCRKAFTFAKAVVLETSLQEMARADLQGRGGREPDEQSIQEWVDLMSELLHDVELGRTYVYFDGIYIPTDATGIRFTGWHARHDLPYVPQVEALRNPQVMGDVLSNPEYWEKNSDIASS